MVRLEKTDHFYQRMFVTFVTVLISQVVAAASSPAAMSMLVHRDGTASAPDYVQVQSVPPEVSQGSVLTIDYACSDIDRILGMEISVAMETQQNNIPIYRKAWKCQEISAHNKEVTLNLPPKVAFKPSKNNPDYNPVYKGELKLWLITKEAYDVLKKTTKKYYDFSLAKAKYEVTFPSVYSRPEKPLKVCFSWIENLIQSMELYFSPYCPVEPVVFYAINFPVALNGGKYGVHRVLPEYHSQHLRIHRAQYLNKPSFTVEMWLYVIDYCLSPGLCSIMQRLTWDDLLMTPLIYVNKHGFLHLQVVTEAGQSVAHLSTFPLLRQQWIRLVLQFNQQGWNVTMSHGEQWKHHVYTSIRFSQASLVWYDDTQGLHIFGGSETQPSFKGYIGLAKIYRADYISPNKLSLPSLYHPMFELGVSERHTKCRDYLNWVSYRIYQHQHFIQTVQRKKSCIKFQFPDSFTEKPYIDFSSQCPVYKSRTPRLYRLVNDVVRRKVLRGQPVSLEDVAQELYQKATQIMDRLGLEAVKDVMQTLKQASCYGNHDATYFLTVLLNGGIGIKADEKQAQSYLMYGALDVNRLCLLSLGNKHSTGLDGIPQDSEQAYVYYKNAADLTRRDQEVHSDQDVYHERVRLTDEVQLDEQTDENGDLFQWIKHQAAAGVATAQHQMARVLFWGQQGLKRNLQAAVEYYRMGAERQDPTSMYDYGIVLLKGQGTKKNMTEATKYLHNAAETGNDKALNALGWHALEIEKNTTKAAELLQKAMKLGNPDAAHNLGHMYLSGTFPNTHLDRVMAFRMFSFGALRGQLDSAIMVGLYNQRGHPEASRNPSLALQWVRYVSEHNPALSRVLSKGLRAYKNQNWQVALLYYKLAADAGIEVGDFNVAYLCDENKNGMIHFLEKDCALRHFKLATNRELHQVHPYALIKMGDYYWSGYEGRRNIKQAADMYIKATLKGEPQALFNLAFIIEEGHWLSSDLWKKINIPLEISENKPDLLKHLYSKCAESTHTEAYIPCKLALLRLQVRDIWMNHYVLIRFSSFIGIIVTLIVAIMIGHSLLRRQRLNINNV